MNSHSRLFSRSFIQFLFYLSYAWSQTAPVEGLRQNTPQVHAFVNAHIIPAPGKWIEKGTLVIRNSVIEAIGPNVSIPADAKVWDVKGQTVYPGLIDPYSDYGIVKPRPSTPGGPPMQAGGPQPFAPPDRKAPLYWNDAVHPERNAVEQFLPDKESAEKLRALGFTMTQTNSLDGIFRGSGAIVNLSDGGVNDVMIKSNGSQFLSFIKGTSTQDYPSSLMGSIALIRQTILDAQWYGNAKRAYEKNPNQKHPEDNLSLEKLSDVLNRGTAFIFEVSDELDILRVSKIAKEFSLPMMIRGSGYEYRRLDAVKQTGLTLILPVNFPDPPVISTVEDEVDVSLADLKHWDLAAENPKRVSDAGIPFAFTRHGLKDPTKFYDKIREAIARGLQPDAALAALTSTPAKILGVDKNAGTLEAGKLANFIITDGSLFAEKTKIRETWIEGKRYEVKPIPEAEVRGFWNVMMKISGIQSEPTTLDISGEPENLQGNISAKNKKVKAISLSLAGKRIALTFEGDSLGYKGIIRMAATVEANLMTGMGQLGDGKNFTWIGNLTKAYIFPPDTTKPKRPVAASFDVVFPEAGYGRKKAPEQPNLIFIKSATIWTSGPKGKLDNADLIVRKGKISELGQNLKTPEGAFVIDGKGKHVTPGIIDEHSHIAIDRGVNEGSQAVTAEVRVGDVIDSDDINIYRQLAGGVTTSHLLHGSANPIGGQCQVIRMRWGELPENLKFNEAPPTIKFALGENVKQSNWGDRNTTRYPQTRMGVEQLIRDEFQAAKDYRKEWEEYNTNKKADLVPPRKDLELEAILEVLEGKRFIHCHSYVQSEILMLIRVAEEMGFKVQTFTHILEGYKVADEMVKHGAGGGSFSDWWDYKFEVYDAIPYNGALMWSQGVVTSFNSDDAEMARRLNQEAGKAVKYGNVPEEEALKFVTINPAKQLKVDQYVGSLESGKDADFVIWNGHPLSAYSKPLQTWVEGKKYFDVDEDRQAREEIKNQRTVLIQKVLAAKKSARPEIKPRPEGRPPTMAPDENHRGEDVFDYMKGGSENE